MSWLELRLDDVPRERVAALSDALFALGCGGIQEDHPADLPPVYRQPWDDGPPPPPAPRVILRSWWEDPDRAALDPKIAALAPDLIRSWEPVPDTDWETAWQQGFPPIHISPRLIVAPPWEPVDGAVILDPGVGFGTGQHETTRGALRAIDRLADGCQTLLDVGCGSGILALAGAHLGLEAVGVDIEAPAVEAAKRNAEANGLSVRFGTEPLHRLDGTWDLVVANIHAEALVVLRDGLVRRARRHLVLAGILADRESKVLEAFAAWPVAVREQDGEWICLQLDMAG